MTSQPPELIASVTSQIQNWIHPLKVRVAASVYWRGKTIGERLSQHTIKTQAVLEADQWEQGLAVRWLALGSLLQFFKQQRGQIFSDAEGCPRSLLIYIHASWQDMLVNHYLKFLLPDLDPSPKPLWATLDLTDDRAHYDGADKEFVRRCAFRGFDQTRRARVST
jgi:hypothetical protein